MDAEQVQIALLRIMLVCLGGLIVLGLVSFICAPSYIAGVQMAEETLKDLLLASLGAKAGMAVPGKAQ